MSTPEDQLARASGDDDSADEPSASTNGFGARLGLRGRRRRDVSSSDTMTDDDSDDSDLTAVSSDDGAPAPPKRRRFGKSAPDDTVERAEAEAPPSPISTPVKREPVAYSTTTPSETETELEESIDEDPYPARSAMVAAAPTYVGGERHVRATIRKVDLWSVTKLSLCFYVSSMFVMIVALVALWLIADAAGVIKNVEDFLGDLLSAKDFTFLSGDVLRGTILVGLVIVALQVVITVIAASFYNIFSELFGGLEMVIKEEEELR
jgi:hypothetical protein